MVHMKCKKSNIIIFGRCFVLMLSLHNLRNQKIKNKIHTQYNIIHIGMRYASYDSYNNIIVEQKPWCTCCIFNVLLLFTQRKRLLTVYIGNWQKK